jgi:hypothetical protein
VHYRRTHISEKDSSMTGSEILKDIMSQKTDRRKVIRFFEHFHEPTDPKSGGAGLFPLLPSNVQNAILEKHPSMIFYVRQIDDDLLGKILLNPKHYLEIFESPALFGMLKNTSLSNVKKIISTAPCMILFLPVGLFSPEDEDDLWHLAMRKCPALHRSYVGVLDQKTIRFLFQHDPSTFFSRLDQKTPDDYVRAFPEVPDVMQGALTSYGEEHEVIFRMISRDPEAALRAIDKKQTERHRFAAISRSAMAVSAIVPEPLPHHVKMSILKNRQTFRKIKGRFPATKDRTVQELYELLGLQNAKGNSATAHVVLDKVSNACRLCQDLIAAGVSEDWVISRAQEYV